MPTVCLNGSAFTAEGKLHLGYIKEFNVNFLGVMKEEVRARWRKLHSEELHNLYSSPKTYKGKGKFVPVPKHHAMNIYRENGGKLLAFLTSALDGGECSAF
jgi:hypothetical protein